MKYLLVSLVAAYLIGGMVTANEKINGFKENNTSDESDKPFVRSASWLPKSDAKKQVKTKHDVVLTDVQKQDVEKERRVRILDDDTSSNSEDETDSKRRPAYWLKSD